MTDELRALDWKCHAILGDPVLLRYSTDYGCIPILLAEIERRVLRADFMEALEDVLGVDVYQDGPFQGLSVDVEWRLLTATPEQHVRAFIATIERYS